MAKDNAGELVVSEPYVASEDQLNSSTLRTIASVGSMLAVGSIGSIASAFNIGSIASLFSVGSIGSVLSAGSILSFRSTGSLLSINSQFSILSKDKKFAIRNKEYDPQEVLAKSVEKSKQALGQTASALGKIRSRLPARFA